MALTALMGTYHHNIDAKGRMSFPTKLRDLLGGEFYVTKSINQKCLTIYSKSEWEKLANKIAELPDSMGGLDIKRWLFSGAGELVPDKQGRVLIPSDLREFAGLKKDVVVIGLDDKAEIWDKELWDAQQSNMDMSAMLAAMQQLGI
ncbi:MULTISPECIES: division/cell wall cluster transcriptional repressor MraZ [Porcipelethomonas]|jgi:MraZ protein|uniref:division/cell wall cluster transcriptional repressor MraZ n=1 Tax=Porcipelethomonas TaxID=2981643 RepID=UPI000822D90F|nr:division/cell wall cluster transcriptional repressor MraZ [Porcipelethomonas ammoniilytica]MCU6720189.1 division/cell wall cluster transcriptional repressor MraZ [Porcipelethomonas ammoniilytica]MEE0186811.1 division/cell wall cluster transcriptional repressor MraZ [Oscillospiraceae bacterium]OLA72094.1 MAG: division/cell wall cluster transcriptional repressor MraZ [Ruminococcus sp. 37_24]SCJ04569.1 cell division protein MraZ [uncultured Ruminococcus sp.]